MSRLPIQLVLSCLSGAQISNLSVFLGYAHPGQPVTGKKSGCRILLRETKQHSGEKMNTKLDAGKRLLKPLVVSAGVFMMCAVNAASADAVEDMCRKSDEVCACAAKQLKSDVGDDDYELYAAVGAAYIANQASGMQAGDAWDAAVKAESGRHGLGFTDTLNRTNAIGKAHRKAMKACK
jgi:hypothetical protein